MKESSPNRSVCKNVRMEFLQKVALLGTARILRKVLEARGYRW